MPRAIRSLVHGTARRWSLVIALNAAGALSAFGCQLDDGDYHLDQDSGATSSRGGGSAASSTSGGKSQAGSGTARAGNGNSAGHSGGASGTGNVASGGEGGDGSVTPPDDYPAPSVDSMQPTSGAYGSSVTITGHGLGNASLAGFTLRVGNGAAYELTPKDKDLVTSWTDDQIVFRYPFPADGSVSLEAPRGEVVVGDFQPTWLPSREIEKAPAATALASIVSEPGHLMLLFDTTPLTLLDVGPDDVVEHGVTAPSLDPSSVRLYLDSARKVAGVGLSTDATPTLVALENEGGDLVGKATTIKTSASEVGVGGGRAGAAVWMRRTNGWYRARPGASGWTEDKGPTADPNPDAPNHAAGVSSDGSLYVAWSIDTGNFLDDMGAAEMQRMAPTAAKFAFATPGGSSVDDYVTGLSLRSRGDGLIVTTCGSDVDPFGLSGTDRYCFDALHAASGAHIFGVPVDQKSMAYAFTSERAVVSYCAGDQTWRIRTDADVETEPGAALGEPIVFPCPEAVALELDGGGDFVPVVRWAGKTYLLARNAAVTTP